MRLVVVESPFAGDRERNKRDLDLCILDCIQRGENPYASHYMLPNFLDDDRKCERDLGIQMGFQWAQFAEAAVFYIDHGMSEGMKKAEQHWSNAGKLIQMRTLFR